MTVEIITPIVEVYDILSLFNSLPIPDEDTIYDDLLGKRPTACERLSEYIGRVCYNSYDKLTASSYFNFNRKAASDAHRSVFEFNNIRLSINVKKSQLDQVINTINVSKYLKYQVFDNTPTKDEEYSIVNVYGSIRAFIELIEKLIVSDNTYQYPSWLIKIIDDMAVNLAPSIYWYWSTYEEIQKFLYTVNRLTFKGPSYTYADITTYNSMKNNKFNKFLIKIKSDKGLHNEIVRHRPMAVLAESQRYVRYGIGENAKNPFQVCVAACHMTDEQYINAVKEASEIAYSTYQKLLEDKYKAQLARAVLPVGTAMTYFIYVDRDELNHILSLRAATTALPMAQEVAKEIFIQAINKHLI